MGIDVGGCGVGGARLALRCRAVGLGMRFGGRADGISSGVTRSAQLQSLPQTRSADAAPLLR